MMQLPSIRPAEGHLASVLIKHLAVGTDLGVSPEITANLVEMVEIGSENLTHIAAPSLRVGTGMPWHCDARAGQQDFLDPFLFVQTADPNLRSVANRDVAILTMIPHCQLREKMLVHPRDRVEP